MVVNILVSIEFNNKFVNIVPCTAIVEKCKCAVNITANFILKTLITKDNILRVTYLFIIKIIIYGYLKNGYYITCKIRNIIFTRVVPAENNE